jgi:hypothetical protein
VVTLSLSLPLSRLLLLDRESGFGNRFQPSLGIGYPDSRLVAKLVISLINGMPYKTVPCLRLLARNAL